MDTIIVGNFLDISLSTLIGVDDVPLLVLTAVLVPKNNWLTFFVLSTHNIKCLSVLGILDVSLGVLE